MYVCECMCVCSGGHTSCPESSFRERVEEGVLGWGGGGGGGNKRQWRVGGQGEREQNKS